MAKVVALISAICVLAAVAGITSARRNETFIINGSVYCDPCRVKFKTKISETITDAVVRLECRNITTEAVTYSKEATTTANGTYTIEVEGEHGEEICDVVPVKSPREDCNDTVVTVGRRPEKSQVVCSDKAGMHNNVRYANPLFFMKEKVSADCAQVLKEMEYIPLDDEMVPSS